MALWRCSCKCPKQILYYYIDWVGIYAEQNVQKKIKFEFHVFSWFPGLQNLDVFWKFFCRAILEMIFRCRNSSLLRTPFFDFLTIFHMVWKNQESWEIIWLDVCWGNQAFKNAKKILLTIFFFFCFFKPPLWIYTNCFEILNFVFSNIIPTF